MILICLLLVFVENSFSLCQFNVSNHENYQPVLIYNDSHKYEFARAHHQGLIQLNRGQEISLLCVGNRNYVKQSQANVTTVTCVKDTRVQLFKQIVPFNIISCKKPVKGETFPETGKCGKNGKLYSIGYRVTREDILKLIAVCHIFESGRTIYTHHRLYSGFEFAPANTYRPTFNPDRMNPAIKASEVYKQPSQIAVFQSILGDNQLINGSRYLAKGHLSPMADFLTVADRATSFFLINSAPQWQTINTGSWKSVEITIRDLAKSLGYIEVWTGTHGILEYSATNGENKQLFLGPNNTLPVPKYFWKIAYQPDTREAVAFVCLNDPYAKSIEEFCQDVCVDSGFWKKSWQLPETGLITCCNYKDFHRVVQEAPELKVDNLLRKSRVRIELL